MYNVVLISDVHTVIQLYMHKYLIFFKFFSHLGYYRILSRVLCAM